MSSDEPNELPACPECNGSGRVEVVVKGAIDGGDAVLQTACPDCGGSGELVQHVETSEAE